MTSLAKEADALFELVKQFTVGAENAPTSSMINSAPKAATVNARPVISPARQMANKLASAFKGNAAVAAQSWEEF